MVLKSVRLGVYDVGVEIVDARERVASEMPGSYHFQ